MDPLIRSVLLHLELASPASPPRDGAAAESPQLHDVGAGVDDARAGHVSNSAPVSYGSAALTARPTTLFRLPHEIYGAGRCADVPVHDGAGLTGSYDVTGVDALASLPPPPSFPPLPLRADAKNAASASATRTACDPYEEDIDDHVRTMEKEARQRPSPDYMSATQTELDPSMRATLISWLHGVSKDHELAPGALHLAVSCIDRFMSRKPVRRADLRLVGAAAIYLAAKFEDAYTNHRLDAQKIASLTDHGHTKHEVLAMEVDVLNTLGYEISGPTTHTFLERFMSKLDGGGVLLRNLARQLAELVLLDYRSIGFLPSVVAASAVLVARLMLNPLDPPWNRGLQELTGYMPLDLLGCVAVMRDMDVGLPFLRDCDMKEKYMEIRHRLPDTNAISLLCSRE